MTRIRIFVSDQVDRIYPAGTKPRKQQLLHPSVITFKSDDVGKCIRDLQALDIHHFEVVTP